MKMLSERFEIKPERTIEYLESSESRKVSGVTDTGRTQVLASQAKHYGNPENGTLNPGLPRFARNDNGSFIIDYLAHQRTQPD